jgi:hypothetical protein
MQPIPLQTGDLGISQVTSVVTSATWTSGTFGLTLLKRIVEIPIAVAGVGSSQDWAQVGLPEIPNNACLMLMWHGINTTGPTFLASLDIIDK